MKKCSQCILKCYFCGLFFVVSVLQFFSLFSTTDWKRIKNLLVFYFCSSFAPRKYQAMAMAKARSEMLNECNFYRMGWRAVEWFKMLGWIKDVYLFKRTRNINALGIPWKFIILWNFFYVLFNCCWNFSVVFVKDLLPD